MKTYQLIAFTTALFIVLFYNETLGLNVGILGLVFSILIIIDTPKSRRSGSFLFVIGMSFLSACAFAWYGDFASFLALFLSVFLSAFLSRTNSLKPLLVIPVFAFNFLGFIYRFFVDSHWLPPFKTNRILQRVVSVLVIPALFVGAFLAIYSAGSENFANVWKNWNWNLDLWQFIVLAAVGFFVSYNIWYFSIPGYFFKQNHFLKNEFLQEDKIARPTWQFLDLNAERSSGVISFLLLNGLLAFFIIVYNVEQFSGWHQVSAAQLSENTHERVGAVIVSIIMAVFVIMFYFKSHFNFDEKAKPLRVLALIWVVLNAILVLSSMVVNAEYVINFGITYKRLGVFAFLILCLLGLYFTLIKLHHKRTNAFLFNRMIWFFYGLVLICSFINWGGIATRYNLKHQKGDANFLKTFSFNEHLINKGEEKGANAEVEIDEYPDNSTWLSHVLYFETLGD